MVGPLERNQREMNRKKWSNEEKITIVLDMINGAYTVAVIYARHGVIAAQAYK